MIIYLLGYSIIHINETLPGKTEGCLMILSSLCKSKLEKKKKEKALLNN
jgi:hypothetical protein